MKRLFASALLAMALLLGMTPTAFAASAFTDVPDTHWASSYIQRAYEKGWVNGMSQTIYAPSDSLTRAQFLKMMATAFYSADLQTAEGANAGAWYAPSWTVAQKYGLEKGTNMTKLSDLTAQISRYDMAQVIVNVAVSKGVDIDTTDRDDEIRDWNSIPRNYWDAVSASYTMGVLNGKNGGVFAGQDTMTRAEAATVLCRMDTVVTGGSGGSGSQKPTTQTPNTQKPQTPGTQQPSAAQTQTPQELAAEVVRLVNVERAKEGLPALGTFDSLTKAAEIRAPETAKLFSHNRPDGSSCFTALDATGASKGAYTSGENIAAGSSTAADVVEQWMNSPGHRANILNKDFTHIGVGYSKSNSGYGHYWVQMFVGTKNVPDSGSTQKPGTQNPGTQNPGTQNPGTQNPGTQNPGTQNPGTQNPGTQNPGTQNPGTQTPGTQNPGTQKPGTQNPGTQYPGPNPSDDLLHSSTYLAKKLSLSCLARYNMPSDSFSTTELYIYSTSDFYGKDYTVSWSVDNPDVLALEEITSKSGNPAVRFYGLGVAGKARITCTVTTTDGMTATQFCDVTVVDG